MATKLNDAAFRVVRIRSISSGVTQFWSTMMLVVPSAFVTVLRHPPIAPSSVAERRKGSLRRELGQVRERAARARLRRELEERRLL